MIRIDIPMPKKCTECPCFDNVMYGKCNVTQKWFDGADTAWTAEKRPDDCPLKDEMDDLPFSELLE